MRTPYEWRSPTRKHIRVTPTTFVKRQTIVEPTPHRRTAVEIHTIRAERHPLALTVIPIGVTRTRRGRILTNTIVNGGGRSTRWQILEMWRVLESLSHGQHAPFPSLVFLNENGRPIGMMQDTRQLLILNSHRRRRGPCPRTTLPMTIGMGTKTDGPLKILVHTFSKAGLQSAVKPLTTALSLSSHALRRLTNGPTGIIAALPEDTILLTHGTLRTINQSWTFIVLGNPRPHGSPLGPGTVEILTGLATTITTSLLLMDDVELPPRVVATTPPIVITTTRRNEIGGTMTGISTSASSFKSPVTLYLLLAAGLGARAKDQKGLHCLHPPGLHYLHPPHASISAPPLVPGRARGRLQNHTILADLLVVARGLHPPLRHPNVDDATPVLQSSLVVLRTTLVRRVGSHVRVNHYRRRQRLHTNKTCPSVLGILPRYPI